jgi:hypothetical protein
MTYDELKAAYQAMQALCTQAADALQENIDSLVESSTNPDTGLLDDDVDLLAIESDTDLVARLRAAAVPVMRAQPEPYLAGGPLDGLIGYTPPAAQPATEDSSAVAAPMQSAERGEPDHGDELTIAYMSGLHDGKKLAAQPAVPLTDEQIVAKALHLSGLGTKPDVLQFARAIEAAHGIAAAQPAVQEPKELFGYEIWNCFYRSREELLEAFVDKGIQWVGVKADGTPTGESFNGYNKEWIEANIREVYVHGTPAIAKREAEAKKGQP